MPWNFTKKETVYLYLSPMIKLSIRVIYVCSVNEQCHQISLPDTMTVEVKFWQTKSKLNA